MATKHASRSGGRRDELGISLIETAIVVAVIAVVGAAALPSFAALLEGRRLESAATRLAADLQWVRGEAVARNRTLRLSVRAADGATCWIVHTGAAGDCACTPSGAVCSGDAVALKWDVLGDAEHVAVSGNVSSIVFDPLHGTSTPTGTLRLVGTHGRAVHHVVNVLGRVRSCSPDGLVAGYPLC